MKENSFFNEVKELVRLSIPLFFTQIAQVSMGFVDSMMSGHAGTLDLAAVSLGSAIWFPTILFGQGILVAFIPSIAKMHGAKNDTNDIGHEVRQGVWLSLLLSVPIFLILRTIIYFLPSFGYSPDLTDMTVRYLGACSWAVPAFLIFSALRCSMDALSRARVAMNAAIIASLANVLGNYVFIFGKWGFPRLGGVGSGVSTSIVCYIMAIIMLMQAYLMPDFRKWLSKLGRPDFTVLRRIMNIGLPNAIALLCEITMFGGVAMLLAPLGATVVASNQITISLSGIVFMIPLSLSMATSIRVGTRIGQRNPETVRFAARAGILACVTIACVISMLIIIFREQIPFIYTRDEAVASTAYSLLIFAAIYQIPDGLQVVAIGALRAYNATKSILVVNLLSYWVLGLPLGYILGRTSLIVEPMAANGFWIAINISLALASLCLFILLKRQERKFSLECSV